MAKPVKDWLIFIGGFMQDRALAETGMCGLAHRARDRYPQVLVDYEPWKCDWKSTAEWIFRWSRYDVLNCGDLPPRIMVVAYSWGAGWGLVQLAEHLQDRGLMIDVAVASDAVRHIGWNWSHAVGLSQLLAYFPYWSIEKPGNIDKLHWFRQSRKRNFLADYKRGTTWLYGHPWIEFKDGKPRTCPNGVGLPMFNHSNMDDAPLFHSQVFNLADHLFQERVAT